MTTIENFEEKGREREVEPEEGPRGQGDREAVAGGELAASRLVAAAAVA